LFVKERFQLNEQTKSILRSMVPDFGYNGFGEFVYYRTYSRRKDDGEQENWADTVIRGTEGTFSIRKDWYVKNHISWDEDQWQQFAGGFALSMFKMEWLPPGRGLWAMGSDFVYERGGMALINCAFTLLGDNYPRDLEWLMDSLMHGVGVGFKAVRNDDLVLHLSDEEYTFVIEDTRESWCKATRLLLESFLHGTTRPVFDYSKIRKRGLPIKGFGGVASGPEPLIELHEKIVELSLRYIKENKSGSYDSVMYLTDIANLIGCCVVAGNVRRSAEIALGEMDDPIFADLKNYNKYPYRAAHGWMSNNSVILLKDDDFEKLGEIAERVKKNGEPGYVNLKNFPYGRIGKFEPVPYDHAIGINPCGEIPLENKETCNLSETLPTRCESIEDWYAACQYATFYSSTVSLLPTHQPETNTVVARNRRIGVGIIDFTGWKEAIGLNRVTRYLREGYKLVREANAHFNAEAGVPAAIRVTTMKPGGTVPKIAGRTAGCGYPTFKHTVRRVRVAEGSSMAELLKEANVPWEKDYYSKGTEVFEFPIIQGPAKPADQVTIWEQAMNLILLQREWADNAVSNTLYFKPKWELVEVIDGSILSVEEVYQRLMLHTSNPERILFGEKTFYTLGELEERVEINRETKEIKIYAYNSNHEEDDLQSVLSAIAPLTKSVSLLPHTPAGVYPQTPEEGISEKEYLRRVSEISNIDWSKLKDSDGMDEMYCSGGACEVPLPA
jgi:ribonucleoside-triphosphate reductase